MSARSHWWVSRDVRRLIARAEFTAGGPLGTAELRYLKASAELLLNGPLDLSDSDRERVAVLHRCVLSALAERVAERIEVADRAEGA